jgi:hypothetical protein
MRQSGVLMANVGGVEENAEPVYFVHRKSRCNAGYPWVVWVGNRTDLGQIVRGSHIAHAHH